MNKALEQYIQEATKVGMSAGDMRKALITAGWKKGVVDLALGGLSEGAPAHKGKGKLILIIIAVILVVSAVLYFFYVNFWSRSSQPIETAQNIAVTPTIVDDTALEPATDENETGLTIGTAERNIGDVLSNYSLAIANQEVTFQRFGRDGRCGFLNGLNVSSVSFADSEIQEVFFYCIEFEEGYGGWEVKNVRPGRNDIEGTDFYSNDSLGVEIEVGVLKNPENLPLYDFYKKSFGRDWSLIESFVTTTKSLDPEIKEELLLDGYVTQFERDENGNSVGEVVGSNVYARVVDPSNQSPYLGSIGVTNTRVINSTIKKIMHSVRFFYISKEEYMSYVGGTTN
jgi:hypothetical protein